MATASHSPNAQMGAVISATFAWVLTKQVNALRTDNVKRAGAVQHLPLPPKENQKVLQRASEREMSLMALVTNRRPRDRKLMSKKTAQPSQALPLSDWWPKQTGHR